METHFRTRRENNVHRTGGEPAPPARAGTAYRAPRPRVRGATDLKRSLAATLLSCCMVLLFIVKNVLAYRLAASYLVFTIPYVLSNTALFTLLLLGIKSKPKDVDDGNAIFLVSLVVGNLPIVLNLFGVNLAGTHIDTAVRLGAQCFSLAAVPFYIVAVITLGKRISVLPEAKSLQTGGVYRFSRHPLYATYIYWYALQILILQSWTIAALSVIQTAMQIVRARHEESILEKNFPEYAAYSTRVWWIGPNLFGKSRPADGPSARRRPYLPLADPAERVPGLQEHT